MFVVFLGDLGASATAQYHDVLSCVLFSALRVKLCCSGLDDTGGTFDLLAFRRFARFSSLAHESLPSDKIFQLAITLLLTSFRRFSAFFSYLHFIVNLVVVRGLTNS